VDAPEAKPKGPHVDGRKQFADSPPEPFLDTPVVRLVSDADVKRFQERIQGQLFLAPLTKGGNLPFRRLCVDFGCNVTVSEMVFARFLLKGNPVEKARLRRHASEPLYGVQIATNQISEGVNAGRLAFDAGADFLDLNCGCPIHETWKRGLGAALLRKPAKLERLVRGIVEGVQLPVTVKIRLGAGSSEAPAQALAEACERAGASAVVVHGRTKDQRYTKAANWNAIGEIQRARDIPVVGNGDILTWYEHKQRLDISGASAAMVGRGALIKPWIFKEVLEGKEWEPTPEERVEVYLRLCGFFKDHFQEDAMGMKRYMEFMPWHFGFFCRYRPLPEATYGAMAVEHPLLQTRVGIVTAAEELDVADLRSLERLLRCENEDAHERICLALWHADGSVTAAVAALEEIAGDGSLERWDAEAMEEKSRETRGGDERLGGGEREPWAIRG